MKKGMKYIAALLLIASFSMVLMSNKSKTLRDSVYYHDFNFSAGDTISNNDTTYYVDVIANKAEPLKYDILVDIDTVSGTNTVAIVLKGKVMASDSWTDITTVNWAGTADTVFTFSEHSTAKYYRYWRVYFDATTTAQKSQITDVQFKFWSL
jgi:hypothetical protein